MTNQKGFTLIELMIVVAIIGILASVAVPQYETYTAKSKVSTVYNSLSASKAPISNFYNKEGVMPLLTDVEVVNSVGLVNESVYTDATTVAVATRPSDDSLVITATFDNVNSRVDGKEMVLTYLFTLGTAGAADKFSVACTAPLFTTDYKKYLPKACL